MEEKQQIIDSVIANYRATCIQFPSHDIELAIIALIVGGDTRKNTEANGPTSARSTELRTENERFTSLI